MKFFYKILCTGWVLLGCASAIAEESFVAGFEDLPLMNGLTQDTEELSFDTPVGKIVESYAYSDTIQAQSIMDFYLNSLPQLGWNIVTPNTFSREGEKLTIETSQKDDKLIIKFFLQPNN